MLIKSNVDLYARIKAQRLALSKEVDHLKEQEETLKQEIISHLRESGQFTISGESHSFNLKTSVKAMIPDGDWTGLYAYIKENDAFDLLHKRLTDSAVKLRIEDGINLPGVELVPTFDLTVAKG